MGAFVLAILDPLRGPAGPYSFHQDTSHLLLLELARRGYSIHCADPASLLRDERSLFVRSMKATVLEREPYFAFESEEILPADAFSLILMRKDPPVDSSYLYATQLLSLIADRIPVMNSPRALRDWNEKLAILHFPKWIPPTLVTADKKEIDRFVEKLGGEAVLKSLGGFGSRGVSRISRKSPDYVSLLDEATQDGTLPVMVQAFLPGVQKGEKRVFLIDGTPLGALLKIPPEGRFLTNPDLGGHLAPASLTAQEKKLCRDLSPFLKKNGIFFAGVDLIDGRLIEINITSPGLVWEWNQIDNRRHEREIVDALEKKIGNFCGNS